MASSRLTRGRCSQPGAYYAVTTVTHNRRPAFSEPLLAGIVIAELERCICGNSFEPLAWVLMPDHLHLLLHLRQGSVSRGMQALKSRTAKSINAAVGMHDPIWQPGFYDHRLRHEEDLATNARYILANPLRAGLVCEIEDYPYWWCRWIERQAP